MKIESRETTDPRDGIARFWRVGPVRIRLHAERPPQDWLKFELSFTLAWYNE